MALNLAALKGLFGKLKPAAKTIANYGDDVAGVVANYGDDAAKALTTYGDDVAQMAFANADDLAAATAQTDNIAKRIRDADAPALTSTYDNPNGFDWDLIETSDDYGLSEFDFRLNGARNYNRGPTDDLISYLNDADAELDSLFSNFDPNAYKSGLDGTPDFDAMNVQPSKFGGYSPDLVGSFTFPDGFTSPDTSAMYYDSLERGYIPAEWGRGSSIYRDGLKGTGWAGEEGAITSLGEVGIDAFMPLNDSYKAYKRRHLEPWEVPPTLQSLTDIYKNLRNMK